MVIIPLAGFKSHDRNELLISQGLFYWFNVYNNHTQWPALFQNIFKVYIFLPKFQIFCPFLTFFCPFLLFFWKIACMPLLSTIGRFFFLYLLLLWLFSWFTLIFCMLNFWIVSKVTCSYPTIRQFISEFESSVVFFLLK